jgi:hypothetical protein
MRVEVRGAGRALFAAILLTIAGTLNMIYGIAGIADATFFDNATRYVFSDIDVWGWIATILGLIQLTAGFSLMTGGMYGRVVGIFAASVGAVGALMSVGGAFPFWSLGVFALCVIVIHGLVVYGEPEPGQPSQV